MTRKTTSMAGKRCTEACTLFLTLALPTVLFAETYLLLHNTLDNNGRWTATKQSLEMLPMGSVVFAQDTQALARNRLNLGAWHGFQEVLYADELDLERLTFDFWLEENAYLAVVLDKAGDVFSGVRLSLHEAFPDAYFRARADGEFVDKKPLAVAGLRANEWNRFSLACGDVAPELTINGAPVDLSDLDAGSFRTVGFRGSMKKVLIDNIRIYERERSRPIVEDFRNHRNAPQAYGVIFLLVASASGLLAVLQRWAKVTPRHVLFSVIVANLVAAVFGGVILLFVYYSYAEKYPLKRRLATGETAWVRNQAAACRERLQEYREAKPQPDMRRILFVGTSQTHGSGARKAEDVFVNRLEERLNSQSAGAKRVQCINMSVRGGNSGLLLELYETEGIRLNPEWTVINLSVNDGSSQEFAPNLERFIDLNEAHGIKTLLVLEAVSIEGSPGELLLHPAMRKVARRRGVPLVDLHGYLKANYDRGFIWWDFVHPTSFGHKLIADCLFDALVKYGIEAP